METSDLKSLEKLVEKSIQDVIKKGTISPAETKACIDGLELLDRIDYCTEKKEMKNGQAQYSGHEEIYATPRRYNITSYGPYSMARDGYGMMSPPYSMDGRSYGVPYMPPMMDHSMEQGRTSRHSIEDRAVSCLEKMMDDTKSDYERQLLHKYIEMIRSTE